MNESANTLWYGVGKIGKELGPKAWEDRALHILKNKIIPKVSPKWQQTLEKHKEGIAKVSGFVVTAAEMSVVAGVTYAGIHALTKRLKVRNMGSGFGLEKDFWKAKKSNSPRVREILVKYYKPFTPVVAGAIITAPLALRYREEPIPAPRKLEFHSVKKSSPQKEQAARYKSEAITLRKNQIGEPSTYFARAKVGGERWEKEHTSGEDPKTVVQKKPDELADYYATIRKANLEKKLEEAVIARQDARNKYHADANRHALERAQAEKFDIGFILHQAYEQSDIRFKHNDAERWYAQVLNNIQQLRDDRKHARQVMPLMICLQQGATEAKRLQAAEQLLAYGYKHLGKGIQKQLAGNDPKPNFIAKASFWVRNLHAAGADAL